ncbi:hypothetical protein KUTeg_005726, partial [Tegillarca granosa]
MIVKSFGTPLDVDHQKGGISTPYYWRQQAKKELEKALKPPIVGVAKNTILFLGDGMGIPTVTGARILKGQMQNKTGEECQLSFDKFPNVALSKTYNQDHTTPDSAGTATAYLCGVKTNMGMIGVDARTKRGNCLSQKGAEVQSILDWSLAAGKSVGIVTVTRVTDATPAGAYAHVATRSWEGDHYTKNVHGGCKDIALQLIEDNPDIQVIMGGGRRFFLPYDVNDPEHGSNAHYGRRDGRNLIQEWENDKAHHGTKADKALHDAVMFSDAVAIGDTLTNENDTLIVVTADHSHTMMISGYPSRGNDILGKNYLVLPTSVASSVFTLLIAFWDLISGFPSGAPGNSCLDPAPYHFRRLNATHTGFYYPQPMASNPYTLTTSSSRYVNGMMLRVTLQAPPGENFRGFFIHALPDNQRLDAPDRPTYGTFVPAQNSQNSQPRSCRSLVGMVGGITHTNNENKTEVAVDWIPPLDYGFLATDQTQSQQQLFDSRFSGNGETPYYWRQQAKKELEKALKPPIVGVAKNTILFLGDGMGIPTVTGARILKGQMQNKTGEECQLSFDKFPNVALSKTYNQDHTTPDSAGTATAYLCGVKTNMGMIGVDARTKRGNCLSQKGAEVQSILDWSLAAGKSVGIVTVTRVTDATPAGAYAHVATRSWEGDHYTKNVHGGCKDIALQLIEDNPDIQVIMGGGRRFFLPYDVNDPEHGSNAHYGRRDGRNLIQEWENDKVSRGKTHAYVWNQTAFDNVDPANTDYLLGEPSLKEMTEKAIKILQKNPKGFFLLVEDKAHHGTKADKALHDAVMFSDAVAIGDTLTNENDTLIVVTADHSHTMMISGYPSRGNDILDSKDFVFQSGVQMYTETHGGEDVGIFARGPMSHLFKGVHEQNYIPHVMAYASCVDNNKCYNFLLQNLALTPYFIVIVSIYLFIL